MGLANANMPNRRIDETPQEASGNVKRVQGINRLLFQALDKALNRIRSRRRLLTDPTSEIVSGNFAWQSEGLGFSKSKPRIFRCFGLSAGSGTVKASEYILHRSLWVPAATFLNKRVEK